MSPILLLCLAASCHAVMYERLALVTAYSPSIEGGGAGTGITSTGMPTSMRPHGAAVDPRAIPYGSVISVPGYRQEPERGGPFWHCDDTGAALRNDWDKGVLHIDVRMRTVWSARQWGVRWLTVTIYTPDKENQQ